MAPVSSSTIICHKSSYIDNSQVDSPPSLQRLLALDKSIGPFHEQLQQAVKILGVEHLFDTFPPPVLEFLQQKQRFDARAEWVLKWLLGKLQTEGTLGAKYAHHKCRWSL